MLNVERLRRLLHHPPSGAEAAFTTLDALLTRLEREPTKRFKGAILKYYRLDRNGLHQADGRAYSEIIRYDGASRVDAFRLVSVRRTGRDRHLVEAGRCAGLCRRRRRASLRWVSNENHMPDTVINIAIAYNDKGEHAIARLEDGSPADDLEDHTNVRTVVLNVTLPALETTHYAVAVPADADGAGGHLDVRIVPRPGGRGT